MKIRYVVSSMLFWWRENHLSFEQECEFLKSRDFGIELWPNIKGHNECRYNRRNWSRLENATDGMLVSMRSRNDDPTLEQWEEQLKCATLLGANIVTDLRNFGIPNGSDINGCDFAAEVVKLADFHKIKLCLEGNSLKKLKAIGKKIDSVWYCLDTGYANLDNEFTFKDHVNQLGSKIAHIHLTDNYGQLDDHQPPGLRGGISRENWDYLLNTLNKYDNEVIGSLEMSPCMPDIMLRQASEFLFDELKWPNPPKTQTNAAGINYNPI